MLSVQLRPGPPRHAIAPATLAGDPHAGRLLVLGVDEHHVGDVDRAFLLDHAARGVRPRAALNLRGALVALHDVQTPAVDTVLGRVHAHDRSGLAAVLAADDDHFVVAADLGCHFRAPPGPATRCA